MSIFPILPLITTLRMKYFHNATFLGRIFSIIAWLCMLYPFFSMAEMTIIFSDLSQGLATSSFPISFWWGGNEFAGTLIITDPSASLSSPQDITYASWWQTLYCTKQVKWYYFNAARWAWLLPLHNTNSIPWLVVNWWLYTACYQWAGNNDIVWIITYQLNGQDLWTVVFWTDITSDNRSNNSYNPTYKPWAVSRQHIWENLKINGMFFDSMLWIGSISSSFSTGVDVTDLIGTFNLINIQWHVGIGKSVTSSETQFLSQTSAGTKTLLNSSDEAIASTIINTVEKNKAKHCRNANTIGSLDDINNVWWDFICIKGENNTLHHILDENIAYIVNKDIVFLAGNVFIDENAYSRINKRPLSLYIAQGNLILDSDLGTNFLTPVDKNWFSIQDGWYTKWLYLLGNYIINGVVLWAANQDNAQNQKYTTLPLKTYIHGKFTSLNTFTTVSEPRENLLRSLMSNRQPDYSELKNNSYLWGYFIDHKWNASMEDMFTRRCADSWTGGIAPTGDFSTTTKGLAQSISCLTSQDKYPLIIIEKNIPSLFFNK